LFQVVVYKDRKLCPNKRIKGNITLTHINPESLTRPCHTYS